MSMPLPELPKIEIKQDTSLPEDDRLATSSALIWLIDSTATAADIQTLLADRASKALGKHADSVTGRLADIPADSNPGFVTVAPGTRVAVVRVPADLTPFRALGLARSALAGLLTDRPERIDVLALTGDTARDETMAEATLAALHAALFQLPRIGKPPAPSPPVTDLAFFNLAGAPDLAGAEATAEGNNLARWLTHLPGNRLNPGRYRALAEELARREGWESRFLDIPELEDRGAGAFLSVVAASPHRDAGILHLRYRPPGSRGAPLALVGKGICFDTGGTNLKNAGGMLGMHGDMQGSAVALGTLLALTRQGFDRPVDCWLALAENHIGSRAVKCNDVVTAVDGTTIELINTDAEGRMVLADTLAIASAEQPATLLDYATLTGSCVAALGDRMSGAISNRPEWTLPLIEAGERSGERVWPMPYAEDYNQDLESGVADTLQCRPPGEADHLYAARLLGRFVDTSIGWVHVDLSSGTRKEGLAHIPTEVTGFGVRFGVEWLRFVADGRSG